MVTVVLLEPFAFLVVLRCVVTSQPRFQIAIFGCWGGMTTFRTGVHVVLHLRPVGGLPVATAAFWVRSCCPGLCLGLTDRERAPVLVAVGERGSVTVTSVKLRHRCC